MAQAAREPFEQVRNDLAQAIRTLRSECIPPETARQLLQYEQPGHTAVVGLDAAGEKVVLYHEPDRYAIAVEFGPDGLAEGGAVIASFRSGLTVDRWVEKLDAYWSWVHPRHRHR